jgi:hypothetical protein
MLKTGTKIKLWSCPQCGRQFERKSQPHSCRPYLLAGHFKGKAAGRLLYEKLKKAVKNEMGSFKIESLACCIHFVSTFTFAAVKIFKDMIRVDFSLSRKIKSKRIGQFLQMSAHRYLYVVDIFNEDDIDEELLKWIREAYDKKREKVNAA